MAAKRAISIEDFERGEQTMLDVGVASKHIIGVSFAHLKMAVKTGSLPVYRSPHSRLEERAVHSVLETHGRAIAVEWGSIVVDHACSPVCVEKSFSLHKG